MGGCAIDGNNAETVALTPTIVPIPPRQGDAAMTNSSMTKRALVVASIMAARASRRREGRCGDRRPRSVLREGRLLRSAAAERHQYVHGEIRRPRRQGRQAQARDLRHPRREHRRDQPDSEADRFRSGRCHHRPAIQRGGRGGVSAGGARRNPDGDADGGQGRHCRGEPAVGVPLRLDDRERLPAVARHLAEEDTRPRRSRRS